MPGYCPNCGVKAENSNFCANCGARLVPPESETQVVGPPLPSRTSEESARIYAARATVWAVVGLILLPFVGGLMGIILGFKAKRLVRGRGDAGIMIGVIGISWFCAVIAWAFYSSGTLVSWGLPLVPERPPATVELTAVPRGDQLQLYFTATSIEGIVTPASGHYTLEIDSKTSKMDMSTFQMYDETYRLYNDSGDVTTHDYSAVRIGLGAFSHSSLVCVLRPFPLPKKSDPLAQLEARLEFDPASGGRTFTSTAPIFY